MQKFNLGKFNVQHNSNQTVGYINAVSGASCISNVRYNTNANINAESGTNKIIAIKSTPASAVGINAISGLSGRNIRAQVATLDNVDAVSGMTVRAVSVIGIQFISLPDIVLEPGETLIIDTDRMTVTIDGENAIHLLSGDSEFFFLAQGENIITYSDNSNSRNINLNAMWKNRWV